MKETKSIWLLPILAVTALCLGHYRIHARVCCGTLHYTLF